MGLRFLPLTESVLFAWAARMDLSPQVLGGPPDARSGWRLVGSSNREIARGTVLGGPGELRVTVADIVSTVALLHLRTLSVGPGQWVWQAVSSDVVVAASARAYHRRRECALRGERFVALVPTADLRPLESLSPLSTT